MRNRSSVAFALLFLGSLVVAACSSGPAAPGGATNPPGGATNPPGGATPAVVPTLGPGGGTGDSCATLTTAEIQSVLGTPVQAGKPTVSGTTSKCEWDAQDQTAGSFAEVDLIQFDADLWALQKNGANSEPMSGLGEEAFRWQVGSLGPAGVLEIKKGAYEIDIFVFNRGADKQTISAQQLALANLVLSRV